MSDIPPSMKLSCKSLFSSYSNTVMHTDNYNTTACLLTARFNQIYLKLRERDQARETRKWRGEMEKSKANSSEIIFSFINIVSNVEYLHGILICYTHMQFFDLELCFSFTYCISVWCSGGWFSDACVFTGSKIHMHKHYEGLSLRQHDHGTMPSIHRPKITRGWLLQLYWFELSSPSLPTVLLPLISPSLQFWHPTKHIYLNLWMQMEICGRGAPAVSTRDRQHGGRVYSRGTNFKVTSFWEPHFQRLFLAVRLAAGLCKATQEGIITTLSSIFTIIHGKC